jgi:hypothetical protein
MGEYTNTRGIRCFLPDNTTTEVYLNGNVGYCMREILEIARDHFGSKTDFEDVSVTSEYIQTECIGFDGYDPSDYAKYIVLTLNTGE